MVKGASDEFKDKIKDNNIIYLCFSIDFSFYHCTFVQKLRSKGG